MGAITARPLGRAVVILLLTALSIPSAASAAEIFLGVAPGSPSSTGGPGTLIRASDSTAAGVIIGDAFPSEQVTGYGGLAFDSSGGLWATVGKDDNGEQGDESGTLASTLVRIDPTNGAVIQNVGLVHDGNSQSLGIRDLAIQPSTNVIFGVNTSTSVGSQPCSVCIYTIDALDGEATLLGQPMQGSTRIVLDTLAFGPSGILYGTGKPAFNSGQDAFLYTINPDTLAITSSELIVRGDTSPLNSSARSFGLAVRPTDGTIFGTLCCTDEIVYRDNSSGKWFNLGQVDEIGDANTYADLAFAPEAIPTPVPASVWLFGSGLAALLGLRRRRA